MGVKGILKGIGINLAVITGICTIIGGTILTFDKFNRCLRSEPHVAIYGTKENPKYKVIIKVDKGKCLEDFATEILPKLELENNDLEKMLKEFDSYLLEFDELEKRTSDLEIKLKETYVSFKNSKEIVEKFKGKPIEKCPSKFKDYFINLNNLESLILEFNELKHKVDKIKEEYLYGQGFVFPALINPLTSVENKVSDYEVEDVKEHAQNIIKQITGKDLPKELNIRLVYRIARKHNLGIGEVVGTYSYFKNEIIVEERKYFLTLNTLIHELGHAFSQQNEDFNYNNSVISYFLFPEDNRKKERDTTILEEASAYAFENIAIPIIEDEKLRKKMILARTLDYFDYLDIYVQNKHVKDIHPIATLISDATLTYFKDPVKAFNYLSTIETEDLEPEIMNIMDKNISIYSKNRDLKNELIYKLIPLLQKRYNLELKCIKLTHYDYARFLNLLK